ncbi:MAG: glutamate transport system substrate-binding protein [Pseudonocardiales bacterium]|jgi:glutamate transport system substrate-binding protein|nr:glutamate transport system substrate-binding protein [Pseudonocardiales bacterium]
MRKRSVATGIAAIAVLAGSLAACSSSGTSGTSVTDKVQSGKKLVVGIKFDQPGLGKKNPDGTFSGFDVDVAKYIAKQLGANDASITFKEAKSADRETFLEHGDVDFIVATYSITDARKQKVDFAGPYFVAHQDLLVKSDNTTITGPESLSGNKKLCSVKGSTSAQKVKDNYAKGVQLQEYGTYSDCVDALISGAVDAVTTDDTILAGYAAQHPGQLRVVGKGFSDENYGVGLKKGSTDLKAQIDTAIRKMESDGAWQASLEKNLGPAGYKIPSPPAITE